MVQWVVTQETLLKLATSTKEMQIIKLLKSFEIEPKVILLYVNWTELPLQMLIIYRYSTYLDIVMILQSHNSQAYKLELVPFR